MKKEVEVHKDSVFDEILSKLESVRVSYNNKIVIVADGDKFKRLIKEAQQDNLASLSYRDIDSQFEFSYLNIKGHSCLLIKSNEKNVLSILGAKEFVTKRQITDDEHLKIEMYKKKLNLINEEFETVFKEAAKDGIVCVLHKDNRFFTGSVSVFVE